MRAPLNRRHLDLVTSVFTVGASLLVVLVYAAHAWDLIGYPWDWSPDEGIYLDFARRLLDAPASLYNARGVPVPAIYGPLHPALLAPVVRLSNPLAAARVLTLGFTLIGALAVGVLIRRRAGTLWAVAGAALYLSVFNISSWFMLVRIDTPLVAFWLWSAVVLFPSELRAGADHLSRGRIAGATALLLMGCLVKLTAVIHGLPLVLAWFWVDRRSAWRLIAALALSGLVTLALLLAITKGGYLEAVLIWRLHSREPGLLSRLVADFAVRAWPVILLALLSGIAAVLARSRPIRDPVLFLLAGGLLVLPMASKAGACWNYLLPLYAAMVVAGARWAALSLPTVGSLLPAGIGVLALVLATSQTFPMPTAYDEAAARTLYGFAREFHRKAGGPFLVSRPDLVYFVVGQDAEIEGAGLQQLVDGRAPAATEILERIIQARYTLVVETWPLPRQAAWQNSLHRNYRPLGACRLGSYFTGYDARLYARRDLPVDFTPPSGVRCQAVPHGP